MAQMGLPEEDPNDWSNRSLEHPSKCAQGNFLPLMIVVELIYGDGRDYPRRSLPGIVAGVATTYHHGPLPFLEDMKYHNRERLLDPTPYLQGPLIGPPPPKPKPEDYWKLTSFS